ncbi:MAG: hypothetical protein JW880_08405, partial [Candidatus Thermoplasmatota archaeon]|nr:hypothetical protein [Candidatus Thermoplasmatota archaeon]
MLRAAQTSKVFEELDARVGRILDRAPPKVKIDPRNVSQRLRMDYAAVHREPNARMIEALCGLISNFQRAQINVRGMMEEAAELIQKQFGIREVAIGLKSTVDGIYRYEV